MRIVRGVRSVYSAGGEAPNTPPEQSLWRHVGRFGDHTDFLNKSIVLSLALALCVEDDLKIGVIFWTSYLHDSRYIPIPPSFLTITYIEEKRPVDLEIGAD